MLSRASSYIAASPLLIKITNNCYEGQVLCLASSAGTLPSFFGRDSTYIWQGTCSFGPLKQYLGWLLFRVMFPPPLGHVVHQAL